MMLTNYWLLLIWIVAGGFVLYHGFSQKQEMVLGKLQYRWKWLPAILLALPYIVWAGSRTTFGDTPQYIRTFNSLPGISEVIPYLVENTKDQGYSVFAILFKSLISDSSFIYLMFVAIIQLGIMIYIFRKYSTNYWMSMFMFILSTDYLSWMHNGMRQFIAVTLIFGTFGLIVKKKFIPAVLIILLASTIHGSALIMLPIIFVVQGEGLNKKTIFVLILLLLIVAAIDNFTPILTDLLEDTQYSDMTTNEIWTNDDGTSIIRTAFYSIPGILAMFGKKYIRKANDPIINVSVNCSIITMGLYILATFSSGIYIGRLPIYTTLMGYISLPWLIDNMFAEKSAKLVRLVFLMVYITFFYVQMHFVWGIL